LIDPFLSPDKAFGLTPFDRADCRKKLEQLVDIGLFTPINTKPTLLYPGSLGGSNWGGGALLPSGVLITNVNNMPFVGQLNPQQHADIVEIPRAGKAMHVTMQGTPYTLQIEALNSFFGIPCNPPPWGKLVAIDLLQGKIVWEQVLGSVHDMAPISLPFDIDWGTPNLGGGIATAGGVFFIAATMDKRFRAFDTDTGKMLWQTDLPFDGTAIPMTYTLNGRQFVVINAGGHHMFGREQGDALIAFALPEVIK
jgi:quinoprotein glucose dehydrogenase